MCTVTFVPVRDTVFITSNRDEKAQRKNAVAPQKYNINHSSLLFPRDAEAGGSWIALKENGDVAVLLNGGFVSHIPKPPYDKSRGIVFLDITSSPEPIHSFQNYHLNNIEPFTIIIWENDKLFECRWDGIKKHYKNLNSNNAYIWSSATLYDAEIVLKREQWFKQWLQKNPNPILSDILDFHQFAGDGDLENDIKMNRGGKLFTVSVTGIELSAERYLMQYLDLKENKTYQQLIEKPLANLGV